jgi:hypothetical protein
MNEPITRLNSQVFNFEINIQPPDTTMFVGLTCRLPCAIAPFRPPELPPEPPPQPPPKP